MSIIAGSGGYTRTWRAAPRLNAPGGRSVTECQGCGAWNDTSRTLCVVCGTPLAEIDEWDAAAELPPLRRCPMAACTRPCPPGCGSRRPPSSPRHRFSLPSIMRPPRSRSLSWLRSVPTLILAHFSVTTTSRDGCAISPCGARRRCADPLSPRARACTPGPYRPP